MPVCDLDKRIPLGKTVLDLDLVVWWDRNEYAWKVFDDMCPHRLAPLSQGRVDQWGRLQCVYHGWCFDGSGQCKLIPQAPLDSPPVHTSKRACVAAYPATVQHDILWFWPNSDPSYRDILSVKKPPYIPELDDPSYTKPMLIRELPFGYEILTENLIDPSHVPYAHYQLLPSEKRELLVFFCIPVSPGKSRLILTFPRNFAVWVDRIVPRWVSHMAHNLVLDSDLCLLHLEERKIVEAGISNWSKACFIPTTADTQVVAFRRWLMRYSGGHLNWGPKFGVLPPTPPKEELMDRYWSHVVNCRSCSAAYKALKAIEIALQIVAVALLVVVAVAKPPVTARSSGMFAVAATVMCFAGSRWLSHFIYKTFHFHDYNHALV
ncbi:Protochlorophyllide-dependent translocon component 52, chloroplastic [Linum grandiflorum]